MPKNCCQARFTVTRLNRGCSGERSQRARSKRVGGREGGACTAAGFLWKFTDGLRWAHLDIAGTAYLGGANKGSTGRPVPMLVDYLLSRA